MNYILDEMAIEAVITGNHTNPHEVLGMHILDGNAFICVYMPNAANVEVISESKKGTYYLMNKKDERGIFTLVFENQPEVFQYKLRITTNTGNTYEPP